MNVQKVVADGGMDGCEGEASLLRWSSDCRPHWVLSVSHTAWRGVCSLWKFFAGMNWQRWEKKKKE